MVMKGRHTENGPLAGRAASVFWEPPFESVLHRLSSVAGCTDAIHRESAASVLPFVLFRRIKSNLLMLEAQHSAEAQITEASPAAVTILKELSGFSSWMFITQP